MKNKSFGSVLLKLLKVICPVADKDAEQKNIALMMFLQILALVGYGEIVAVLFEALLKNFKAHIKERCLCKRTIKLL